ncbi:MAG: hypothetical protein ACI97A_004498, partial [Planctomycetota bacterium]
MAKNEEAGGTPAFLLFVVLTSHADLRNATWPRMKIPAGRRRSQLCRHHPQRTRGAWLMLVAQSQRPYAASMARPA